MCSSPTPTQRTLCDHGVASAAATSSVTLISSSPRYHSCPHHTPTSLIASTLSSGIPTTEHTSTHAANFLHRLNSALQPPSVTLRSYREEFTPVQRRVLSHYSAASDFFFFASRYTLLAYLKTEFVLNASLVNPFNSSHFFWIDGDYGNGHQEIWPPHKGKRWPDPDKVGCRSRTTFTFRPNFPPPWHCCIPFRTLPNIHRRFCAGFLPMLLLPCKWALSTVRSAATCGPWQKITA